MINCTWATTTDDHWVFTQFNDIHIQTRHYIPWRVEMGRYTEPRCIGSPRFKHPEFGTLALQQQQGEYEFTKARVYF